MMDRIIAIPGRYDDRAYLFVLAALEFCQRRRPARGHISGGELAWACRDFAQEQFGLVARTVLQCWGIGTTRDIGRVVFELIEAGLLIKHEQDKLEDFASVFDFAEAFDRGYPWTGVCRSVETAYGKDG